MEFRVLGPLGVLNGVEPVEITQPKQRMLLSVLLTCANQVVPLDRILESLWGETPPPRATAALQTYVSSLRRAFEPDRAPRSPGEVLLLKPPGYVLVVDNGRFDAARFATGVSKAQERLAAGDPQLARELLDEVLGLWRGPPYAEFADRAFAQGEAARLEALKAVALEARAEADLALGLHGAAASQLEGLVARYPFRENLWASYLLALYRSGRQADALRAYQACRRALVEELGIGPGPALQHLEAAILAQDPALEWTRPAVAPSVTVSTAERTMPEGRDPAVLVGRAAEVCWLESAWRDAVAARGGCALVSGEAGIGKTRLVQEVARRAATGADVVWGRCHEGEDAPAFWPWSQAVGALLEARGAEKVADALRPSELRPADIAPIAPVGRSAGHEETASLADPGAARFRLYRAVTTVVRALAAERPIMIVLDDIHWADDASLQLMRFLASEIGSARVLLVATYRSEEVPDDHPLVETLAAVARRPGTGQLALDGLGPAEVCELVAAASGAPADRAVAATVHRRTSGNPFFIGELVRLLDAREGLHDPAVAAGAEVPAGVRDVIRLRLARLPEATRTVLGIAAVAGQEFDLDVVEAVAGLTGDEVLDALEPARRGGVIFESSGSTGRFGFCHALLHETLYAGMATVRRARLHARLATALEERRAPVRVVELAHHLWRATPEVPADRVVQALFRAAEESMGALAYEQAEELLGRAIQLLSTTPPGEDRDRNELWAQVRLGMVHATTKGQGTPGAAAAFARARELCVGGRHPHDELPALYGLFLFSWVQVDLPVAATYAAQLLEVAKDTQDPAFLVAGHFATGLTAFEHGALEAAAHHIGQAVVTADSLADPSLADVMHGDPSFTGRCQIAMLHALGNRPAQAAVLSADGLERARRSGHAWSQGVALTMRTWIAVVLRHVERAEEYADEAAAFTTDAGFEALAAATNTMRGWAKAHRGDTVGGMQLAEGGQPPSRLMAPFNLALLAEVEHLAGRTERALATVDRGLAEVADRGERFYEAELLRLRAELLVASGSEQAAKAESCLRRAAEVANRQGSRLLERRALDSLRQHRERLEQSG